MTETVLITGCSSGIGRATAEAFLDEDWTVYATARDPEDIADLAEQGCKTDSLDVTVQDDIDRVVDRIEEETGRIDCLVNNAGYAQYGPMEDVTTERLHYQFDVNVYGPHRLTRAVLPLMRAQEEGTIVNMSSVNGRFAQPGSGAYAGSKYALEAISDALRSEVEPMGIEVVLIEPGPVSTNFNDRLEEELEKLDQTSAYDWLYDYIVDFNVVFDSAPFAAEPEDVATTILDATLMTDPDARYPVGLTAKPIIYSQYLPDRVRDGVFRLMKKLS
jgi:NAD(P)-dependent dehydrogenase (short-subunit alcohol dehydrogenase family)